MTTTRMNTPRRLVQPLLGAVVVAWLSGCRAEMYDQPRYEPQEASDFFRDGTSQRPMVLGTVPRLSPADEPRSADHDYLARFKQAVDDPAFHDHYYEGKVNGQTATDFPIPIQLADLQRGQVKFNTFCAPCHGQTGDGKGYIVMRGFSPPPPLYGPLPKVGQTPVQIYDDLRKAPVGYFYDVITHGHGAMYSYANRIAPDDRWRVAGYVRALQFSQAATSADLAEVPDPNTDERKLMQEFPK